MFLLFIVITKIIIINKENNNIKNIISNNKNLGTVLYY